ncbi:hypothetical protein DL764_010492 [Monosporascus ibericus]|uniref:Uncharacterized protein n=1 Tax=Monosporascus ibericus TaxID=155417 RepID=A0A4Q4SV55_9PEZI|nr:hypothetical protein DL764_010492 [Monosporascus ibericus]
MQAPRLVPMAGSREKNHFGFGGPPLIDDSTSISAGNMPAGIPSPTIEDVQSSTAQHVQANMANFAEEQGRTPWGHGRPPFGNTATALDNRGGLFQAITDSGQSASSAPVTTSIWASPSPDALDHTQGFNIAAGRRAMAAYSSISSQGRTPLGHGRPPFGNTATALGGHDGLFQATINSGQSASSASVAANVWAATSSPDNLDYQQGLNLAAGTQSIAAYDSTLPAYTLVPPVFPSYFQQLPKEIQAQQIEIVLISLRQSGAQYAEISNTIRALFGVEITPNALVKRFGKLQDQYFGPLPEAVKKAMPDLVAAVKDKMACMDLRLSEAEKKAMEDILKELPQIIPRFVQHRVMQKRKGMDK